PNGAVYDSGDYERALDRALELLAGPHPGAQHRHRGAASQRGEGPPRGGGIAPTPGMSAQGGGRGRGEGQGGGGVRARRGVAAALLEAAPGDLVYVAGGVQVAGAPDRRVELAAIAQAAERGLGLDGEERGLSHENRFQPIGDAVPFGTTIAVVAIDRETGRV